MSWTELAYLGVQVRPLTGPTPQRGFRSSNFSASWRETVDTLGRELRMLDARLIVLELDVSERDLRLDGFPKANARLLNPTVALVFESKYGPLRYATAEFDDWQDNLRAIALSMDALRKVDRYGVSKRGEQYQGWKALPSGSDDTGIYTVSQARELVDSYGGLAAALKATHPDTGGSTDDFRRVIRAKELLAR